MGKVGDKGEKELTVCFDIYIYKKVICRWTIGECFALLWIGMYVV